MVDVFAQMLGALILLVPLGSFLLWIWAFTRWSRGGELLPIEPRRPVPWGFIDVLAALFVVFFLQAVAGGVWISLLPPGLEGKVDTTSPRAHMLLLSLATSANLASVPLVAWLFHGRVDAQGNDLGFDLGQALDDIKLGVLAFVLLALPVYGLQVLITQFVQYSHPVVEQVIEQRDPAYFGVAVYATVVGAPLVEEFQFRAVLQGWFESLPAARQSAEWVVGVGQVPDPPDARLAPMGDRAEPAPIADAHAGALADSVADTPRMTEAIAEGPAPHQFEVAGPAEGTAPLEPTTDGEPTTTEATAAESSYQPPLWPIAVSAALFSAAHIPQWAGMLPLFVLGLGLGYLYQRTHRLLPCIVVHLLLNSISMMMVWVQANQPQPPG